MTKVWGEVQFKTSNGFEERIFIFSPKPSRWITLACSKVRRGRALPTGTLLVPNLIVHERSVQCYISENYAPRQISQT